MKRFVYWDHFKLFHSFTYPAFRPSNSRAYCHHVQTAGIREGTEHTMQRRVSIFQMSYTGWKSQKMFVGSWFGNLVFVIFIARRTERARFQQCAIHVSRRISRSIYFSSTKHTSTPDDYNTYRNYSKYFQDFAIEIAVERNDGEWYNVDFCHAIRKPTHLLVSYRTHPQLIFLDSLAESRVCWKWIDPWKTARYAYKIPGKRNSKNASAKQELVQTCTTVETNICKRS